MNGILAYKMSSRDSSEASANPLIPIGCTSRRGEGAGQGHAPTFPLSLYSYIPIIFLFLTQNPVYNDIAIAFIFYFCNKNFVVQVPKI